jgi:hypothetical protein
MGMIYTKAISKDKRSPQTGRPLFQTSMQTTAAEKVNTLKCQYK